MNRKLLTILFSVIFLAAIATTVHADDFVAEDDSGSTTSDSFVLDSGATASDSISIQFGSTINETLGWNISNARFDLSDDLRLDGNFELGTILTFDASNIGSGNSIRIIANQGSDSDGEIRYNASTNQWELSNDGGSFAAIATGAGSSETSSTVIVDPNRTQVTGILYNTLSSAITYINTQSPGSSNRFIIDVAPGSNSETVTIPTYTSLRGVHSNLSTFTGIITLGSNAVAENIKTTSGGKIYVSGGNTAYVQNSDVILGDGSGGLDGTLSITNSFVDGQIDASGIALIYESLVGVTSFTNAGTLGTYNSSVFNLTDTGTWTNYGTAYDNAVLASGKRLTSTTTQGAIDELVEGSPANQITLNKDETGNPDEDVEIIAEQGTENNGVLRYDDGNNRWEYSNDGTNYFPIPSAQIAQAYESGTTTFNASTPIDWDGSSSTFRVIDSIYAHSTSTNPSRITVNKTGLFRVSYNIAWDTSTNSRRTATCSFFVNGVAASPTVGTSHAYARNSTDDTESNSSSFYYNFTSGDYYDIRCQSTGTSGNIITLANQSSTTIEFIR